MNEMAYKTFKVFGFLLGKLSIGRNFISENDIESLQVSSYNNN